MVSTIVEVEMPSGPGEEEFITTYGIWEDRMAVSSGGIGRILSGESGRRLICVTTMQGAQG